MKADQQTLEVLAALRALSLRHKANLADDGKESSWELIGYMHDLPEIRKALDGIDQVPEELANLKKEDEPELFQAISEILTIWNVSHKAQDVTSEWLSATIDAIPALQEAYAHWQNIVALT